MFNYYTTPSEYLWVFFAVLSVILLVGFYLSYRVTLLKTKYDFVPPIIFQAMGALLVLPLAYFSTEPLPFVTKNSAGNSTLNYIPLALFLLAGLFYALHDRTQATVRKNVDVAVSGVIDLSVHVFLILFGILILDEYLTFQTVLGIILILVANFTIAYDFKSRKLNKYWSLGILANFAYAIGIIFDINLSDGKNLPFYVALSYTMGAIYISIFTVFDEKINFKQLLQAIKCDVNRKTILSHISTSFFSVFYTFVMLTTYRYGPVSIATAVISTTVIFNTILSAAFLGERKMFLLKIISAIVGVIGLALVVVDV